MINDQLLGYIRQQLSLNVPKETITSNLKQNGWTEEDVKEAFTAMSPPPSTPSPVSPQVSPVGSVTAQPGATESKTIDHTLTLMPKSRFNKKAVFVGILVAIILVGSASAYAYYTGAFVSFDKIYSESIKNAQESKTATYDFTLNVDFSEMQDAMGEVSQLLAGGVNSGQVSMGMKGSTDISDEQNPKVEMNLSFTLGVISIEAEIRSLDKTIYAKLSKAPILAFIPTISSYENKWYSYTYEDNDGNLISSPVDQLSGFGGSFTDKLTEEQKDHLLKMVQDAHLIKMVKKLPSETITGEPSHHFLFDIDREGVIEYLGKLKEYINTVGKDDSALSLFDPTSITKLLDKLQDFKGEIWIGKNDKLTHKLMFVFNISPDEEKLDEKIKISVVGVFSNWNQPVTIEAPLESTPFQDLISASIGDAQQKGKDAAIKANMSNLRVHAELFYDTKGSYLGFCSYPELKTTRKSIETSGGTGFVCKETSQAYAVGVKFPKTPGYWCVDSSGASRATTTLLSSTSCPNK